MRSAHEYDLRPQYDTNGRMLAERSGLGQGFARQVLDTTAPFLSKPAEMLDVLDVGSGYGHTALELARYCRSVVGIEPSQSLFEYAQGLLTSSGLRNIDFRHESVYDLTQCGCYDLVVLDNVFEHLPEQARALEIISAGLRPAGVLYLLVPNKLWPVEVHYGLPFLSYLPVWLANRYLRWSGRGSDYTDASYAPTYFGLNRMLQARNELSFHYVLPAHLELASAGKSVHYRVGAMLIRRFPWLWAVSKALLVVAQKQGNSNV